MKKAITCASRRTVFCIAALLAISACLGITAAVLHRPRPAATGLSIRMNDQKIRLFDTPEDALSAAADAPAAAEENRLRLSWEGGALTHNVQAYMRAASEGEQGLQTSPYAVVYNFTPKKTEDVMYLRDITDGEKADGTLIQLEFVSEVFNKEAFQICLFAQYISGISSFLFSSEYGKPFIAYVPVSV